jgi:DNA-binding transcriptional LysR family regulator
MKVDPKRLFDLLAVAEYGSFSHAAEKIGVSQPAMSLSIALLEKSLGVKLVERGRKGAQLNDYGELVARQARLLSTAMDRVAEEVRLKKMNVLGPLAIGASPAAAAGLVPAAIAKLDRGPQKAAISIVEGLDSDLIGLLRAGIIDLMVAPLNIERPADDIEEIPLLQEKFIVILRAGHPLAKRRTIYLRDIHDCSWIMPRHGSAFRRHVEALFISAGVPFPLDCMETNSMLAIKAIVRQSDRLSITSSELAEPERSMRQLAAIPLADHHRPRVFGVKLRKGSISPLGEMFLAALRETAERRSKVR